MPPQADGCNALHRRERAGSERHAESARLPRQASPRGIHASSGRSIQV